MSAQPAATPTPATLTCRLPLWTYDQGTNSADGLFIDMPSGTAHQADTKLGKDVGIATYVSAQQRWVPTPRALVAPDGSRYAYNGNSGLHVVDIRSGADRTIATADPTTGFEAIDFADDGIYAGRPNNGPMTPPGLWRLDPSTGAATLIESSKRWQSIGTGYAYEIQPNPTDPVPEQGGQVPDTLYRLDLGTGAVEQWLRRRGVDLYALGLDSQERPLLLLNPDAAQIVTVTGRDASEPLNLGTTISFRFNTSLLADGTSLWLAADQGIYRYTPGEGARLLWSRRSNSVIATIAGACR